MRFRKIYSLILVLAMVLALASCGKQTPDASTSLPTEEDTATVTEPIQDEEEAVKPFALGYYSGIGINPYTCDNAQNQTIVGLVYEPLFELDESFQAQPCIARSISIKRSGSGSTDSNDTGADTAEEVKDGNEQENAEEITTVQSNYTVTATIQLREDVVFSDGSSLDAGDVVYSLECARESGSVYHNRLSRVTSVFVINSYQIQIVFQSGNTSVAAMLDIPIVKEGTGDQKVPVGSGPYQIQLKDGTPHKLVQNEYWWQLGNTYSVGGEEEPGATPGNASNQVLGKTERTIQYSLEEIGLYTAADSDELIFGFSSGDISMVSTDITGTNSLYFDGSYQVFDYDTTNLLYLGLNTGTKSACKKEALRNAIYQAVDRETLVRKSLASHAVAAAMPVAPSSPLYDTELEEQLTYQLDTARSLCADANPGYEMTLVVNADSTFKVDMAGEIEKELESAGLDIQVEALEWSNFKKALQDGDYDLYLGEVKMSNNFDLTAFLNKKGSLNYSNYDSKTLQSLLNKLQAAIGDERPAAAKSLYTQLAEEAPFVPLCFKQYSVFAQKNYLERIYATQSNLFHEFYRWQFTLPVLEADGTFAG